MSYLQKHMNVLLNTFCYAIFQIDEIYRRIVWDSIIIVETKSSGCTSQIHESYLFLFSTTLNGDPYISTNVKVKDTEKLACGLLIHRLPFPGHRSMTIWTYTEYEGEGSSEQNSSQTRDKVLNIQQY